MKFLYRGLLALCAILFAGTGAKAAGWPANFQGVMLQGFYWDSYSDSKWTVLESQADELSQYFKLIWVPNSGKSAGAPSMGYTPVYWFTNHNSSFGTEAQIRSMIQTFKEKGTGIIADVVLNHRSGKSNWTDFPEETWNGVKWKIGLDGICCTDEVNQQSGQAHGTGAPDTGEDFNGSRDLDHTNANVQNNCKNYCKFLLQDMGYAGFRLDMVKGYGAQYTKMYNQYANPTYSVGEYWDGSYDALAGWIESTGKTSAVFDYSFKYAINEAFSSKNYEKLVWLANGNTPQPCGLIHFGYPQYAVTFIENHDTDGNGTNAFSGNVVAANAFMICSPGTPCVFLKHWKAHKAEIKKMIEARNSVGVHNMSQVNVLRHTNDCYMAEVIGTKGRLVVKIGSAQVSPEGYSSSQIYCYGTDYCIWTTNQGGGGGGDTPNPPTPGTYPATLYLQGHVNGYNWSTSSAVPATGNDGVYTFKNVTINASTDGPGFFAFCTTTGATWDDVNSSDRYGAPAKDTSIAVGGSSPITLYAANVDAMGCNSWSITPGNYTIVANLKTMTLTVTDGTGGGGDDPNPPTPGNYPATLYLQGHVNGFNWSTSSAVPATGNDGVYTFKNVTVDASTDGPGFFSFCTATGATWDDVNASDRYGAPDKDASIAVGGSSPITLYAANVSAMGCNSWSITPGTYTFVANLKTMTLTVTDGTGGGGGGDDPNPPTPGTYPAPLYLIGNVNGAAWATNAGEAANPDANGVYHYNNIVIDDATYGEGVPVGYFSFCTILGTDILDWDTVNMGDRYGSAVEDEEIADGMTADITPYPANISAMGCTAWKIPAGTYSFTVDLAKLKLTVGNASGIETVATNNAPAVYYNLMGVEVKNPARGIYIVRRGNKVSKEFVK